MRPGLVVLGVFTLIAVWTPAVRGLLPGPFSAHMTMHMGVVAVAAPLLAFGVAGGRVDPVLRAPRLLSPIPASIVELVAVWAWHAPALHHVARGTTWGLVLEQGTFLASGLLVWASSVGGTPVERADRRAAGVVALLLTSMHMTLLGALLALPPRVLYEHAGRHAHHGGPGGLSPLDDQHLGGAIMLLVGGVSYAAGGLWLVVDLLRRGARPGGDAPAPPAAEALGAAGGEP
jgi:putative membrane protein